MFVHTGIVLAVVITLVVVTTLVFCIASDVKTGVEGLGTRIVVVTTFVSFIHIEGVMDSTVYEKTMV